MSQICIPRSIGLAAVVAVTGAVAAGVVASIPEVKRYLKVRAM